MGLALGLALLVIFELGELVEVRGEEGGGSGVPQALGDAPRDGKPVLGRGAPFIDKF